MTKLQIETKKAIRVWCKKNDIKVKGIRHIFPRAYILAKPAPACIIIATPWQDAEKLIRSKKYSSFNTIHQFEDGLEVGDWCSVAYVVRSGIQSQIAVKCINKGDTK